MRSRNTLATVAVLVGVAGCLTVKVAVYTQPRPGSEQPPIKKSPNPCVRATTSWADDFESYGAGPGSWPETWIADANAEKHSVSYVDGETFEATHGKTLRLHADDANWSAIAYAPVSLGPSFNVSFDVYSTQGCVGLGLRERPTWTAPGLYLFTQWSTGQVAAFDRIDEGGRVTPGARTGMERFKISPDEWQHVDLEVRHEEGTQTIRVTVCGSESQRGPRTFDNPVPSGLAFGYLELGAEVGTVWYDNVTVVPVAE